MTSHQRCFVALLITSLLFLLPLFLFLYSLLPPPSSEAITVLRSETTHYATLPSPITTTYLGEFKITYYCACTKCCGSRAKGITASGLPVSANITIATDPSIIPLHSKVYIPNIGVRVAQDTGSAIKGKRIDVYISDHDTALKLGTHTSEVYLIEEVQ